MSKLISVVTPCYNEEENITEIYQQVKAVFTQLPAYAYEHIFIDNASKDRTVSILKNIAKEDSHVKIIVNARNFGGITSGYYAFLQANGDAVIGIVADLQDPPAMILDFVKKWEEGYKIVLGVKKKSQEFPLVLMIRKLYYRFVNSISEIELVNNATGYGLYDKEVIKILREMDDCYPYFRGMLAYIGFEICQIEYTQPARKRGISKNNFYALYDLAMLGITNHSKLPLRIATMFGFAMSAVSLMIAVGYFIAKLLFWNSFSLGTAPIIIGLFFFASVQLFFIGIIGEYIGSIHTQVLKRPLVIEKERINFNDVEQRCTREHTEKMM